MKSHMFKLIAPLILLFCGIAGVSQIVNGKGTKETETQTATVSGQVLTFQDALGTQSNQFELVIAGGPATTSIPIQGCMRGGTCTTLVTSTSTANVVLTLLGGPYDKYVITPTWTGGTNPTITFNRTGGVARNGSSGVGGEIIAGAIVPPSPLASSACPPGQGVFQYLKKADGTYQDTLSINSTTVAPPTSPAGTVTHCWREFWNTSGAAQSQEANRLLGMWHVPSDGSNNLGGGLTSSASFDQSVIGITVQNTGTGQSFRQLHDIYADMTLTGTPTFAGIAGGENSGGIIRATLNDSRAQTPVSGDRFYSYAAQYLRAGQLAYNSCAAGSCAGAYHAFIANTALGDAGSSVLEGYEVQASNSAAATNLSYAGFHARAPSPRFPTANYGLWLADYGSTANDYNIRSDAGASEQGLIYSAGRTTLNHVRTGGPNLSVASPTCASTGSGTSPSCALDTGSNDSFGTLTVTAGTAPGATGTITLTYNATYGTNGTMCTMMLSNVGTGAWDARATLRGGTMNTGSAVVNWDNNAVSLTGASTYKVNYQCASR